MSTEDVHRRVLNDLLDGVLVVGLGGVIETLNPAAASILEVDADEAAGSTFGELFIAREGYDAFTELIVDAIGQGSAQQRQVVEVQAAGKVRALSVAISYLREDRGAGWEPVAVIAVFSDITEVRTLRDAETRMAKALEAQHTELQTAYRQVEERSEALSAALRKVRVAQGLGTVVVIAMFVGAGLWTWRPLDLSHPLESFRSGNVAEATSPDAGARASRTLTVRPQRMSRSISLKGHLAPGRQVAVRSPVAATLSAVSFRVGQVVAEGDLLAELDLSEIRNEYHTKRFEYLDARKAFETLKNWDESTDMSAARRSFSKATLAMDGQRNKINKSTFLFKEGLISASEHEDAKRRHTSQLLDFEAAKQMLASVRAKGGKEAVEAARLKMERARVQMLALEKDLALGKVRAPLTGSVLAPRRPGRAIVNGLEVKKGQELLRIGDFAKVAAVTQADEIDVVRLKAGQPVLVRGNAFPGLTLRGVLSHISSEAGLRNRSTPRYDVVATLDDLDEAQRAALRVGMSARLTIVIYDNPRALVVPIGAVNEGAGKNRVLVVDPATGETRERNVEVGTTTPKGVEILAGLKAGEKIVLRDG